MPLEKASEKPSHSLLFLEKMVNTLEGERCKGQCLRLHVPRALCLIRRREGKVSHKSIWCHSIWNYICSDRDLVLSSSVCLKRLLTSQIAYTRVSRRSPHLCNDWLKTHEFIIDDIPISHFERESDGRYARFLSRKRVTRRFQLLCRNSQGPRRCIYSKGRLSLDVQQRRTFQGAPFSSILVVEVDNLSTPSKLKTLTNKFKDTYFPAGVRLGWFIDPINKIIYTFMRVLSDVVHISGMATTGILEFRRVARCCPDLH